jgi:hypothetical protein
LLGLVLLAGRHLDVLGLLGLNRGYIISAPRDDIPVAGLRHGALAGKAGWVHQLEEPSHRRAGLRDGLLIAIHGGEVRFVILRIGAPVVLPFEEVPWEEEELQGLVRALIAGPPGTSSL